MDHLRLEEKRPFLDSDAAAAAVVVDDDDNHKPRQRLQSRLSGFSRLLFIYGSAFMLAWIVSGIFQYSFVKEHKASCDTIDGYICRPDISGLWGQYSPYFTVPSDIKDELEDGCEVTFAQILSRHGARDPTLKNTLRYGATIQKIQLTTSTYPKKYRFLKHYKFAFGADDLNAFGKQQLFNSGARFYERYKKLSHEIVPFIRTASQQRVVDSATSWMAGYHKAKSKDKSAPRDKKYPYDMVTIYEGAEFNNTLDHSLCTNIESGPASLIPDEAKQIWLNIFGPPILSRLREDLPRAGLTLDDTHNLMTICAFDTVRTAQGYISPFCDLFTKEEWQQYNHYESLDKFYGWGKGNPLGPTNGVGFTNELIARLTHEPVHDHTSTNHTLDGSPDTFPLDEKHTLFADFSHDNDLTAIFHAMGLYNSTPMISITQVDSMMFTKGWSSSWAVPFAARAYFEKMKCKNHDDELVRVIVNDRVMPLETCGADEQGRCTLSAFVKSLSFARHGGHWDRCFWPASNLNISLSDITSQPYR